LLDRLPPAGTRLFLPVNTHSLRLQRRAVRQLTVAPLPHHAGLLRLCEDPGPKRVRWPPVRKASPERWTVLTDETRSGTDEQRDFVAKALGSPDIAVLEGPPGSGKTTAICELIQQLVARGQRVLLCASTHVAIDNVLERLLGPDTQIDAVRIGRAERVDPKVQATQIDRKVEDLVEAWRTAPHLAALDQQELVAMAERTVVRAANLTCGSSMGIVRHPVFRDRGGDESQRDNLITTRAHWDVLIVDEASKTLIQEFMVPALMAKRWVIVGDVRQLPPFADRADIVANLRSLVDGANREVFPPEHQRARVVLFRLTDRRLLETRARWLIVEPRGVLDRLGEEISRETSTDVLVARVVARTCDGRSPVQEVSVAQLQAGEPAALALAACHWILVQDDLLDEVAELLPADLLHQRDLRRGEHRLRDAHPLLFRHAHWLAASGDLDRPYRDRREQIRTFGQAEAHIQRQLAERDLAAEMAWRLTRTHELRHSRDQRERERLDKQLDDLQPRAVDISGPVAEIRQIGLPSILEVLQEGIGTQHSDRPSALTEGMPLRQRSAFHARFGSLSYQHRMHPEISDFPREGIYAGTSLLDANTIDVRDRGLGWDFRPFASRRAWIDVHGDERGGVNDAEVRVVEGVVRAFLTWAGRAGPPGRDRPRHWEVACLCFYTKQEKALSEMLRRVSGERNRHTRFTVGDVELVCGTVDRFQGREADLVLLSMRNTRRLGFLDSRNRLNVAVTRARQQLVVVGRAANFARCRVAELEALVRRSSIEGAKPWQEARR
jgi:hypothetical protein